MKRHETWHKRKLFKKHFRSYPDWDDFNPLSGEKQIGQYKTDAVQCKNPECPREGMLISEIEKSYYICPFCEKSECGKYSINRMWIY